MPEQHVRRKREDDLAPISDENPLPVALIDALGNELKFNGGSLPVVAQPLAGATLGPTLHTNFGAATKAVVKTSAGNVWGIAVFNANAAVRYAQLHNTTAAPVAAAVPQNAWPVPAGTANNPGVLILEASYLQGLRFSGGIGWAISTTLATFTDSATATDHSVEVMYV